MITEVIFDIESQKLFSEVENNDPAQLGVSIVSAYIREVNENQEEIRGEMRSFWEHELQDLLPVFKTAKRIIGFNTLKFDVPVLAPYVDISHLPHFDIMQHVRSALGHSLGLAHLGEHTLGRGKTDVGTNAVIYWKTHDEESLAKLKYYCEADVMLTKDLYDYGVKNKILKYVDRTNVPREFAVDFSYPKEVVDASRQIGLF
jgi:DEAD/DEAH box helicase domain-containing protein